MSAKEVKFSQDARDKMIRGVDILANAVKFTPPGGQVGLAVRRTGKGLLIQISDTGIGIPADKIEMAMEPFSQVEAGANRNYQGTGLGLPLAKRLVELGRHVVVMLDSITRLARGLASGSALEFANKEMLADALNGRQRF